jgi:hypothetical protein
MILGLEILAHHHLHLLHGGLLNFLEIGHAVAGGVDHFYILDVRNCAPGVAKVLDVHYNKNLLQRYFAIDISLICLSLYLSIYLSIYIYNRGIFL